MRRAVIGMLAFAAVASVPAGAHADEVCVPGDGFVLEYACGGVDVREGDECADPSATACGVAGIKPKKPHGTILFYCGNGQIQTRPCPIWRIED